MDDGSSNRSMDESGQQSCSTSMIAKVTVVDTGQRESLSRIFRPRPRDRTRFDLGSGEKLIERLIRVPAIHCILAGVPLGTVVLYCLTSVCKGYHSTVSAPPSGREADHG